MRTHYDVIVAGGGIAGVAAALASARAGAKTLLLEKESAPGGLATLGLIVIYLPLCDGRGVKMSGAIAEELLLASVKYGPGEIPAAWQRDDSTPEERAAKRYRVQYEAAPMMLACEELLLQAGVQLLYDVRLSGAHSEGGKLTSLSVETKKGRVLLTAGAYVDATGDADLCFFANEPTVDDDTNRRTGWYISGEASGQTQLHILSDPLWQPIPQDSRLYSGTDPEDVTQQLIDGRKWILRDAQELAKERPGLYPMMIPTLAGFRMTRRLDAFPFSEFGHEGVWFSDAIGMIGNWKKAGPRYTIPYRCIAGVANDNLYAAGRCCSAKKDGWDLTRVIPTCAVTGQAAGCAAAMQALSGKRPGAQELQARLIADGVPMDPSLFDRTENA
ncbi:MAG: FAD-dependent oxidoreductase [Eubacteriales bacterium]|nr:FAD-dependent oxidoreductase [Eubacteriales bacterium]